MPIFIAYYRVSTKKQGDSGLGLEAQRSMVLSFVKDGSIVMEFVEVETGKNAARPQLALALSECKRLGATLVVAKLDRLARNVQFTATLMNAAVEFVACDCPYASRLTIHILAAVAEDEAVRISGRTKASLAELKKQGVKLGSAREGHWEGREHKRGWRGADPEKVKAIKAQNLQSSFGAALPLIKVLKNRGETLTNIAKALNEQGIKTPKGSIFRPNTVQTVLARLAQAA